MEGLRKKRNHQNIVKYTLIKYFLLEAVSVKLINCHGNT